MRTFDPALGAQAKLRSKHNTFMAVPVVFIMLSNHFPVATYGNTYSWQILAGLVLVGWGAARSYARLSLRTWNPVQTRTGETITRAKK